jgi:NADH:ubiquinone oxidoreductase subunit K
MPEADIRLFSLFGIGVALTLIIGLYGLLTTKNLVRTVISLEVMTKGVTLLIVVCGFVSKHVGLAQALAITLIVIEVAVTVVAVGIILCFHRQARTLDTTAMQEMKG